MIPDFNRSFEVQVVGGEDVRCFGVRVAVLVGDVGCEDLGKSVCRMMLRRPYRWRS